MNDNMLLLFDSMLLLYGNMLLLYDNMLLLYDNMLLYPLFSLEKKGILISCQSQSVVRLSVCPSVRPSVRPSVTFLVNVSPPKRLEVVTSNFVVE